MFNKYLVVDKEIYNYEELDKIVKDSNIYDGGLEFLCGVTTQEELESASPWIAYENGCTVFYQDATPDCCWDCEYIHVPMTIREMCNKLDLSLTKFANRYEIPLRTIENWVGGQRSAPTYVIKLLERAVLQDLQHEHD